MTETAALHRGRVIRRQIVTPHMVRVTVSDIIPADGVPPRFGVHADEFFALVVPSRDGEPVPRYYTARAWRPEVGELDIDLLLHGEGPATEWAGRAEIGDEVAFDEPRGHYRPPADSEWIGLCGGATALPAIGRIMQERYEATDASASARVHVVLSVDDPADRQDFPLRDGDTVRWVEADALVPETLVRAEADPDTPGYLWFAGEASDMRAVRHRLRRELRRPTDRWTTMGYWRRDRDRWLARYEAAGEAFHRRLEEVYASTDDDDTQADRAEELLAEKGLL
ncbi:MULTISPECIES: siderophore-interacting protein [unclassified Microbacterium]|uniref:siderophore-interacting protein n=1 Tax=unclassified Microbacterium TaxID=2609290 RepID=UPI000C2CBFA0|nr:MULTISPECIES: siderophore-interacting protein [unclassified Microbacterium]